MKTILIWMLTGATAYAGTILEFSPRPVPRVVPAERLVHCDDFPPMLRPDRCDKGESNRGGQTGRDEPEGREEEPEDPEGGICNG